MENRILLAGSMRSPRLLFGSHHQATIRWELTRLASSKSPRPYRPKATLNPKPPQKPSDSTASSPPVNGKFNYKTIPSYVLLPGDTNRMQLRGGRGYLGYAMMGAPDPEKKRVPFLAFPGSPGCRLTYFYLQHEFKKLGVPLVVVEKPGYGISTYHRDYNMLDLAYDARQLIFEHLGYKHCRVIGISGGGPPALAMSYVSPPEEVLVTGIMSGAAPPEAGHYGITFGNRVFHACNRWALGPHVQWWDFKHRKFLADIRTWGWQKSLNNFHRSGARFDIDNEEHAAGGAEYAGREVYLRHGHRPFLTDSRNLGKPWGFHLKDLGSEKPIIMIHGTEDINAPIEGAIWMAEQLPNVIFEQHGNRDHFKVQSHKVKLIKRMMQYN